jgi:hypothetical protein
MRTLRAAVAAALLSALVAVPVSAAAPSSPFLGSWTSVDPVDGSTQHLLIRGGPGSVSIKYVDEFATTCVQVGAGTTVFDGVLTGKIDGDFLAARWKSAGCGSQLVLRASDRFFWFFLYDANTDTLFGALNDGPAVWTRS